LRFMPGAPRRPSQNVRRENRRAPSAAPHLFRLLSLLRPALGHLDPITGLPVGFASSPICGCYTVTIDKCTIELTQSPTVRVQYRNRLIEVWIHRCSNIDQRITCARGIPSQGR